VIPGDNPNFAYFVAGRNQNVGAAWIHIFNPSVINEARYGYNRSVDNTFNTRTNTDFNVAALGLTGFRVVNDGNREFTPRKPGANDRSDQLLSWPSRTAATDSTSTTAPVQRQHNLSHGARLKIRF
jgi:hypothetical protein